MTPERLKQIQEFYLSARDCDPGIRPEFLTQACGGDEELRREVESLLAQGSGEVMGRPAMEVAAELLDSSHLGPGVQIGAFRIESRLGEGGMGAVYRARDTRLGREVALKFLSPWLARDAEYMARFEREAKVLASLNHPNIAIVHGLEESNGTRALVMELVEGRTLAARIKEGPIPLKEALRVAEAIAEGLEAAHEKGIVHRDLKPGNVKISPDGGVKVLDFGLAKTSGAPSGPAQDPSALTGETEPGTILGTVGYMSPEQASGKHVDKRADIWAFGVVLWEMLTGKRLFAGETVSHTLAEVLAAPIDFDKLPKETPPAIRNLVRRCLERDAKNRLRDIGEARIALQACLSGSAMTVAAEKELVVRKRTGLIWILGAAVVLLTGIASWALWPKAPTRATRFQVTLPDNVQFDEYVSISPDGHKLVFNASGEQSSLWVHDLDTLEWRRLPGTEGGRSPFWSPDSKYLGFAVGNQLKKIDAAAGGPPQTLCTSTYLVGSGTWSREGVIVFASYGPGILQRVSSAGGIPLALTTWTGIQPSFLPDGKHFVYVNQAGRQGSGVYAGSLDAKPAEQSQERIVETRVGARLVEENLFFLREGTLMVQALDTAKLQLRGEPVPVAEHVGTAVNTGLFSASPAGVLAYRTGPSGSAGSFQPTWFDRQGQVTGTVGQPGPDQGLVLSPDATYAAGRDNTTGANGDIWLLNFARGVRTRFTFRQSYGSYPVWSPDGSRIIFSAGNALDTIYEKA